MASPSPLLRVLNASKLLCCCIILGHFLARSLNANPLSRLVKHATRVARPSIVAVDTMVDFDRCTRVERLPTTAFVVRGNTSSIPSNHPVIEAIMQRYQECSLPGKRGPRDGHRIALAVEGGGMRGCVSAGSCAALQFMGLEDTVDCVYGASAGAMVAAYFVSRQSAGIQIYHDVLPSAGRAFIDKTKLLAAVGIANPFQRHTGSARHRRTSSDSSSLNKSASATTRPSASSSSSSSSSSTEVSDTNVFNLNFLLTEVMGKRQPLDWETFRRNDVQQPLFIVASSLATFEALSFSTRSRGYGYSSLDSLLRCIRASMNVPGITGALLGIPVGAHDPVPLPMPPNPRQRGSSISAPDTHHAIADAFLVEPIPYRSACRDGATHVIVLRTRPDPSLILGKPAGLFERAICRRFFDEYAQPAAADWVAKLRHQVVYAEDIVRLNDAARGPPEGILVGNRAVHMLPIAPAAGCREVGQLETSRGKILSGMRDGARRTLQLFLPSLLAQTLAEGSSESSSSWLGSGSALADITDIVEDIVHMILPDDVLERLTTLQDYQDTDSLQRGASIP